MGGDAVKLNAEQLRRLAGELEGTATAIRRLADTADGADLELRPGGMFATLYRLFVEDDDAAVAEALDAQRVDVNRELL